MYTDVQASGRSAVFHGAEKNYLEIVKILIQGGADLSLKDKVSTSIQALLLTVIFTPA